MYATTDRQQRRERCNLLGSLLTLAPEIEREAAAYQQRAQAQGLRLRSDECAGIVLRALVAEAESEVLGGNIDVSEDMEEAIHARYAAPDADAETAHGCDYPDHEY